VLDRRRALGHPTGRAPRASAHGRAPGGLNASRHTDARRRAIAVLAAALALVGVPACGEAADPAPVGGPALALAGERGLADLFAVEVIRARLRAASDLYGLGRREDAAAHLAAAREGYAGLSRRVSVREPRLDREIRVALHLLDRWMAEGETRERVRERISPVADQLMEGALSALVWSAVRFDPRVQAETLRRLLRELDTTYARAAPPPAPGDDRARRAFQRAYGLLARAQIVASDIQDSLGPVRDPVVLPLATLRAQAFPGDLGPPPPPEEGEPPPPAVPPAPPAVSRLLDDVGGVLGRRYRL
jgi:hypothetical protein